MHVQYRRVARDGTDDTAGGRAPRTSAELERCDLTQLAHEVAAAHADELSSAACQLQLDLQPEVTGTWERLALEQVITNLRASTLRATSTS